MDQIREGLIQIKERLGGLFPDGESVVNSKRDLIDVLNSTSESIEEVKTNLDDIIKLIQENSYDAEIQTVLKNFESSVNELLSHYKEILDEKWRMLEELLKDFRSLVASLKEHLIDYREYDHRDIRETIDRASFEVRETINNSSREILETELTSIKSIMNEVVYLREINENLKKGIRLNRITSIILIIIIIIIGIGALLFR